LSAVSRLEAHDVLRTHTPCLDIQGLRGFAVLVVILSHAGLPVSGGSVRVNVFFVISGQVITAMPLRELTGAGRANFRQFFERGIRWLFPALTLTALVTVAFTFQFGPPLNNQQQLGLRSQRIPPLGVFFFNSGDYFAAPLSSPI